MKINERFVCQGIKTAFEWHCGAPCPLYSFASTRTIHGEKHRRGILEEIAVCADFAQQEHDVEGAGELVRLKSLIEQAPTDVELVSSEVYNAFAR